MSDDKNQSTGELPSAIGRYQITGTLGFGAMGAVYRAFDPLIKRTLAIKTIRLDIPRQSPQHQAFIERFYQEARISGTLSHPSIVTLFDIGEENGIPFLAMELIDGKTIGAILEEGTRFKPEKVIGLVSQVAAALDYAHSRGVVHRDIKPSNLIVHEGDKVKVSDFGIAKLADSEITHSGALLGTPSYMSPEQAMGEKLDGRSDIFSLGVVAFEMLSGQQPFPGANVTSILYRLVHVDPVEPANLEMNGLVPQKWREVFHKVLAKKAESRYQTASAFVQDLEYCLGAWFTGLGDEETISLPIPAQEESTLTLPKAAQAVPPVARGNGSGAESDTLVLSAPPSAGDAEVGTTLVMEAVPVLEAMPPQEPTILLPAQAAIPLLPQEEQQDTVLLAAAPSVEEAPPVPTVASPPRAGSLTLPPEPTVRDQSPAAPARGAAARTGVPVGWAVGGAAAVAVLALGIVGWALWQRSHASPPVPAATVEPTAPASEAPPVAVALPTAGSLQIDSEPAGARVRVNGQPKGQTPLRLEDLPFGAYEIRVEQKGYDAQTRTVSLDTSSPLVEVRVALLRPSAPATGAADILSTPPGAAVSVDGRPVGHTPLSGVRLKPGTRRIEVSLDDHETWTGSVDVSAGETGRVEVRLRAIAKPPAAQPTPEAVDTARVYENTPGEVDVPAKKVSGASPSYPADRIGRLKSGERVSVLVRVLVNESGEVQDVTVAESGGKALDDVVVSAVRRWKFQPATKRGTRVKVQMSFKQTFLGG
jgi:TonB family protein